MMSHTPEPWAIHPTNPSAPNDLVIHVPGNSPVPYHRYIARIFHPESSVPGTTSLAPPPEIAEANARRVVACVNACAGIATEDLEAIAQQKPDDKRLAYLGAEATAAAMRTTDNDKRLRHGS